MEFKKKTADVCDRVQKHKDYEQNSTKELRRFVSTTNKAVATYQEKSMELDIAEKEVERILGEKLIAIQKLGQFRDAVTLLALTCDIDINK